MNCNILFFVFTLVTFLADEELLHPSCILAVGTNPTTPTNDGYYAVPFDLQQLLSLSLPLSRQHSAYADHEESQHLPHHSIELQRYLFLVPGTNQQFQPLRFECFFQTAHRGQ